MIREKINERMIKAYIKATSEGKYTFMTYGTYVVGSIVLTSSQGHAAGNVVEAATSLINDLKGAIVAVSTAAAVVGVGSGAFLKKFSLGKGDRIENGNKLITNSIWGWVLINGLTSILSWAGSYFGGKPT